MEKISKKDQSGEEVVEEERTESANLPESGEREKNSKSSPFPLTHVSIMVGDKKLRLKIADAPSKMPGLDRMVFPDDFDKESAIYKENPFVCTDCGKCFSSRIKLLRHSSEHTGLKPFTCNYCGKGFTHRQSLTMHERIHTGEKPFECPICTKCFARQTNYNIHMKLHASGRRYFCSFCGKWFRTEHEMLDHQQNCLAISTGHPVVCDRPLRYRCDYCEKMFHHRRDKCIHERTHTGERPYSCGYCLKGFTQSQALTIHIRTHTGERPYSCDSCGKDFRDSSALRKHEFVKHASIRTSLSNFEAIPVTVANQLESSGTRISSLFVSGEQLDPSVL